MKKLLFLLLGVCFLLVGCGVPSEETPAERYLAHTSEDEMLEIFTKATYITGGFSQAKEISTDELFRFAVLVCGDKDISWYDESLHCFFIPLTDIEQLLDDYFEEYTFVPMQFSYGTYDGNRKRFICSAIGFSTGSSAFSFVSAKTVDEDIVEVVLEDDADTLSVPVFCKIEAKIEGGAVKFLSCQKE